MNEFEEVQDWIIPMTQKVLPDIIIVSIEKIRSTCMIEYLGRV